MRRVRGGRYTFHCAACGQRVQPRKPNKHGYCGPCWRGLGYPGKPSGRTYVKGDAVERFMRSVHRTDSCWLWVGARKGGGRYGAFWSDGVSVLAHRWSYETFVGAIPDGLTIDHLCRVTSCVNPAHLEPVTLQENCARRVA